ncbi:MAG: metallophosphoesterase family protein [Solirubrobacteraceae bacterium]
MRLLTRREALRQLLAGTALLAAGCGTNSGRSAALSGSTLDSTWADPGGTGVLSLAAGEPLLARTELGGASAPAGALATLAQITDAHGLDAASPARVPFLDRLGPPFQSTFRPQETLTGQVLAGAVRAVRALGPDAVIQGGDLIDNDQANELSHALAVLRGAVVCPASGGGEYFGVQSTGNPDPFYYRPDLDAPRHPGLLAAAVARFTSVGLRGSCYPVLGDHDILVAGEIAPTPTTRALALGDQAVWELPPRLTVPPGAVRGAGASPDGPPSPGLVDRFLMQALAGPKVRVPTDAARREMDPGEVLSRLRSATGLSGASGARLDYSADVGSQVRLIVLDLVRRAGGSGGLVSPGQPAWLASELADAGERWVIVVSHQPLSSSEGGGQLLALLDRHPRVIAAMAGHTHRNRIEPRSAPSGGYWLINTAALIDYPQQARAIRVLATAGGGVALQTWMLDHIFPGELGAISRQLAYLDAQGGRPNGFAGGRLDRNVTLYRTAVR